MKRTVIIFIMALTCTACIYGQSADTAQPNKEGFMCPGSDSPAAYPGGMSTMQEFLRDNVQYPKAADGQEIEGCVICTVVIGADGYIQNIKVAKSAHPLLDSEAVRLIKAMPRWIPGRENLKPATTDYPLPIYFHSKSVTIARDSLYEWQRKQETAQKRGGGTTQDAPASIKNDGQQGEHLSGPAESMPSFPGGIDALMQYLSKNIKYPKEAEKKGIQGRVVCTLIVEKDGSITNVKVAKSVSPELDAEAVRVIEKMPRWSPGIKNGVPVRVKHSLPMTFRLK